MAIKNLVGLTKDEFMEKKETPKHNNVIEQKRNDAKNVKMVRQTLYLPEEINRILWHHRIDTGKSISKIVTNLTLKHIKNKDHESLND
jgi:hypothetical protein